jgi:spore germination cell wall hydrolase CwlJ-like protein
MARTVYGEARSELYEGKVAVAHVILNRVQADNYPNTIAKVIKQPWQFSVWNPETVGTTPDANYHKTMQVTEDNATFMACIDACKAAYQGRVDDPTEGATHYHTKQIDPYWADDLLNSGHTPVTIDNHVFYKPPATI